VRLDKYLVAHGYFESRNRAAEAIKSGEVLVDGISAKASQKITDSSRIEIKHQKFYVSRAARKLESFLVDYPLALDGKNALDIGSSTGGFAQILLERGVGQLSCVDVGSQQLHHTLREHPLLRLYEETDIRDFQSDTQFTLITCDVSFISVLQIIDTMNRLAAKGCDILILYKPQFEVGREVKRDSRGVVQDSEAVTASQQHFIHRTAALGWQLKHHAPSQLVGKEGNLEYLYHFVKQ